MLPFPGYCLHVLGAQCLFALEVTNYTSLALWQAPGIITSQVKPSHFIKLLGFLNVGPGTRTKSSSTLETDLFD